MAKIVVSEDDRIASYALMVSLKDGGHSAVEAPTLEDALSAIKEGADMVIVSDTVKGYEQLIKTVDGSIPMFFLTSHRNEQYKPRIVRPYHEEDVVLAVGRVLKESSEK